MTVLDIHQTPTDTALTIAGGAGQYALTWHADPHRYATDATYRDELDIFTLRHIPTGLPETTELYIDAAGTTFLTTTAWTDPAGNAFRTSRGTFTKCQVAVPLESDDLSADPLADPPWRN